MGAETVVAIVGVVISSGAAVVALWQAHIARQQATSARDSAASAQRQAEAAEAQIEIMRVQSEGEQADRRERRRPHFTVETGDVSWQDVNFPRGELTIQQEDGVALSSVMVSASGDYVLGLRDERSGSNQACFPRLEIGPMRVGEHVRIGIGLEHQHVTPLRVVLELECVAREGGDTWSERLVANFRDSSISYVRPQERGRFRFGG